jgi:3-hydroxyacyl-CoA dehydrogenase
MKRIFYDTTRNRPTTSVWMVEGLGRMTASVEGQVRIDLENRIAVVIIDNPPVNAGSVAIRRGLLAAIAEIEARADIDAAVLIGAGNTFVSGSDIREFDGPILEPSMPAVIAAIEACSKPVVAAIHGNALGGGFEIALGCDARLAIADSFVGLPEVTLGIIPGAGGTQRLPRLTGKARAVELITTARRVPAPEALRLGMIDRIAAGDLRQAAVALARERLGTKRRLSEAAVPADPPGAFDEAAASAVDRARRNGAIAEAVSAVQMAGTVDFPEAMARERAIFQRLRQGEESAALRHLFFAERRVLRGLRAGAGGLATVGVVGLGLMGSGIAACLAFSGLDVLVTDRDDAAIQGGEERIRQAIELLARRARAGAEDRQRAIARVRKAAGLGGLRPAGLVIEAVFEDLAVKQEVFRELDGVLEPDALIASNTSYLDIDALAGVTGRPDKVAGLHFFSPVPLMRPVEVVRGAATATDAAAVLRALAARIGKLPIPAGNVEGFIGNRILVAYRAQCEYLLEEGAYPEDIDRALTDFGMAMGPFAVADMAGLDIAWAMRKRKAATRDPRVRYVGVADRLCEAGRFGRKAGAGWYRYSPGVSRGEPDAEVRELIEQASRDKGIARRAILTDEIRDRALAAMVNAAAMTVAEGIAEDAGDVDLLMVNGYGFPANRGGPLFWASRQPRTETLAKIDRMVLATGFGARRAENIESLLWPSGKPA